MKNKRIIQAYDTVTPSAAQKAKMLDAILEEADLKEQPRKIHRTPNVRTMRPGKKRRANPVLPIAAALAMILAAGCILVRLARQPEVPVTYADPTQTVTAEKTAGDHYAPVIAKYSSAIAEGWSQDQCEIDGISPRVQAGYDVTKAGYAFLDLDGDGRDELIIAEESTSRTDNIWDLYTTLEDGTPIQLWVDELEGGQCKLCEDNVISISYSMKDELEQTFYKLESGQLSMLGQLQWEDEDTVFHTDAQGNTRQVTSREGQAIGYSYEHKKLNLTWLGTHQETDALEHYTPVLEKYRTALLENWDKYKCIENNISSIAAFGADTRTSLGWCLRDIDGNGIEELLISYGNESGALVDLYSIQPEDVTEEDIVRKHGSTSYPLGVENGICHLAKSEGAIQYTLCEDGTVRYQFVADGTTNWCDYLVKPWGLELQDVLVYYRDHDSDKTYARGPHENDLTYISKEEAGEFISAHVPVGSLPVIPLVDWDEYEVAPQSAYASVVERYKQALAEKWDLQQCGDNDISLMISYFVDEPDRISAQMMDLDSNGVDELIITDGMMIYDLYTMQNGSPVKLLTGWERNAYRLCQNNVIYNQGSNGAASSVRNFYQLMGGELVMVESVVFDAIKDFDNPWFRSSDGETPEVPITEEEANRIMDSYPYISMLGIDLLDQ